MDLTKLVIGILLVLVVIWFGSWFSFHINGDEWFVVPTLITLGGAGVVGLMLMLLGIDDIT